MANLITAQLIEASTQVVLKSKTGDLLVPPLACGTWSWGDKTWGYDEKRDLPGVQETWTALNSRSLGFYDTAEVYGLGLSETNVGKLLEQTSPDVKKDVIVATKWLPIPILPGRLFPPKGIVGCLEASLARLKMDSVHLYQVHGHVHYHKSIDSVAQGLADCVNKGLCKAVGVSNYSKEQMLEMHESLKKRGIPLASNQIEYSLLRRLPEYNGLIQAAQERDIVIMAYSPIAQGRLSGKYSAAKPPPSNRRFSNYPMDKIEPLLEVMRTIAERRNVPVTAVALNWIMCKGVIPLPGARNAQQAEQNAQALGWRLSNEETEQLESHSMEGSTSFWQKG